MSFIDFTYIEGSFVYVLPFLKITILLTVGSVLLGTALGLAGAVAEVLRVPYMTGLVRGYVLICRSLPNIVLLYLVYYGLPIVFLAMEEEGGIRIPFEYVPSEVVALLGLGLHTGAYLTEIFRAALLSVREGQIDAARSLGMTWSQIFRRVVFPQAAVFAVPLFANQVLSTMKSTSICFVITVIEIFGAAKLYCESNSQYFEAYIVVACLYWGMGILSELGFARLERRLSVYKRGEAA